jgi:hypothetical protein
MTVELSEPLNQLIAKACSCPPGSLQRQKYLAQIIRLIMKSGRLWKENTPYYDDALQQTWLYFCRNICEGVTGQAYDPTYGSVITWLNAYLKRRLQDFYLNEYRQQAVTVPLEVHRAASDDNNKTLEELDNLAATPQALPILENLEMWAKADADGELRGTHIKGRPDVNCQVLILKRLPPEVSWKELSEELGLSVPTLSSFYQRQCLPRLRKFVESEGYL